jgi:hypothetical protein
MSELGASAAVSLTCASAAARRLFQDFLEKSVALFIIDDAGWSVTKLCILLAVSAGTRKSGGTKCVRGPGSETRRGYLTGEKMKRIKFS